MEAAFIAAALFLGTKPERLRDRREHRILRNVVANYFRAHSESVPLYETWPPRLHGRMSDNEGRPLDVWERLALAYIWWVDEQLRKSSGG